MGTNSLKNSNFYKLTDMGINELFSCSKMLAKGTHYKEIKEG